MMDSSLRVLSTIEVAALLSIKPQTLRKWRMYGGGPRYVRLGGRVGYHASDIEAWIEANTVQPGMTSEE